MLEITVHWDKVLQAAFEFSAGFNQFVDYLRNMGVLFIVGGGVAYGVAVLDERIKARRAIRS